MAQVILELIKLGDRVGEAVLQIQIRLQLALDVELRGVLEIRELLPEIRLATLEVLQQSRELLGIRELATLYGRQKPVQLFDRALERRFAIGSFEYAQRNVVQVSELRGSACRLAHFLNGR